MHKRNRDIHGVWSREAKARADRKTYAAAPTGKQETLYRRLFKKHLRGRKGARVLILGATPEPRNIGLDLGCEVLAVDYSHEMFVRMHDLIKRPDREQNMTMRANWLWLTRYLQPHSFDIIAGDGAFAQLTLKQQYVLYRDCHTLLKRGGALISRVDVYDPDIPKEDSRKLLRAYLSGKMEQIMFNVRLLLYSELTKYCYNPRTFLMETYKYWDYMDDFYKKGLVSQKQIEFVRKGRQNITHVFPSKSEVLKMTSPHFRSAAVQQHNPYWPTYMWVAK